MTRLRAGLAIGMAVCVAACGGSSATRSDEDGPLVETTAGSVVGSLENGVRVFRGIPYAEPPVGELRWKLTVPKKQWSGERSAQAFGPVCPQPLNSDGSPNPGLVTGPMDEDCLTLNIWTPTKAKSLPVVVFIHGGAGVVGGGSARLYDGTAFARDGIVLITINYRLGALSSFAHPSLTAAAAPDEPLGSYGLLDQIEALRWVQQNAAAFGGDPHNVMLFGQSSGGGSVLQIMTASIAKGLFHKAAVHSGNGWWPPVTVQDQERIGATLARMAGLPGESATIEQLRALDPLALQPAGINTIDGRLRSESVTQSIDRGRTIDVPLLIGWTSFEASSFRARDPVAPLNAAPASIREKYEYADTNSALEFYTDSKHAAPARWIAAKTSEGAPTYLFRFSYVRTADRAKMPGATHGSELPYIFDSWQAMYPGIELSDEDLRMTTLMHACWVQFAKTGEPGCEGTPKWPRYSRDEDALIDLDSQSQIRPGFRKAQFDAIEEAMNHFLDEQRASIERFIASEPRK